MTSPQNSDFLTHSPLVPPMTSLLLQKLLYFVLFGLTPPSPLTWDVLSGWPLIIFSFPTCPFDGILNGETRIGSTYKDTKTAEILYEVESIYDDRSFVRKYFVLQLQIKTVT